MIQYCEDHDISLSEEAKGLRTSIWHKVKEYVQDHVHPTIGQMAIDHGHEVVFSPPHHLDLQPIELIWANVKGDVGCQYNIDTTMNQVLQRINNAFVNLKPKTVQGCIDKANKHLKSLHEHVLRMEKQDESMQPDSDDGSDDDSDNSDDDASEC